MGSFLPGHQQEHRPKKQRVEAPSIIISVSNPIIREEKAASYVGVEPVTAAMSSFNGENIVPVQSFKDSMGENKISFSTEESNGLS